MHCIVVQDRVNNTHRIEQHTHRAVEQSHTALSAITALFKDLRRKTTSSFLSFCSLDFLVSYLPLQPRTPNAPRLKNPKNKRAFYKLQVCVGTVVSPHQSPVHLHNFSGSSERLSNSSPNPQCNSSGLAKTHPICHPMAETTIFGIFCRSSK